MGIFRQGQTYTYRIVWNATSKPSSEGPDLDYTFRVQPQGTHTGFLIDGYDIRRGIANLAEKLIGEDLQNVAADEQGFREKFQDRRAVLMGVSTLSADRMFGASMQVLPGLEDIQLRITNTVTGEDFGTHSQLFANAYTDLREMYGAHDNFGKNIADPRVWFIQRYTGGNPSLQAYLTGDPSLAHGSIRIQATLRGNTLGSVRKTLTADADFKALIDQTSLIASGIGMGYPTALGQAVNGVALAKPHQWATPLRIAAFINGVAQVPQNYFARGTLAELDLYMRLYKNVNYTHHSTAAGYDFVGPRWVQVKTTSNPSSSGHIAAMKTAMADLAEKSPPNDRPRPRDDRRFYEPWAQTRTHQRHLLSPICRDVARPLFLAICEMHEGRSDGCRFLP